MIAPMTKPDQRGHRGRYVALVALLWAGAMVGLWFWTNANPVYSEERGAEFNVGVLVLGGFFITLPALVIAQLIWQKPR